MSVEAEKFDRDLHKLRHVALNLLFDAAGKATRFIAVSADQDDLTVILPLDADGRPVPRGDFEPALAAVSAVFGQRHQALTDYMTPADAIPNRVRDAVLSDPAASYGSGTVYILNRPGAIR